MRFVRQILTIILFSCFIESAYGQEPLPLVHVYCDFVTNRSADPHQLELHWNELTRHFESRAPFTQGVYLSQTPAFQECVRKNAHHFEMGEFILQGKSAVQENLFAIRKAATKPELLRIALALEERQLSTPEWSVILGEENSPKPNLAEAEQQAHQRKTLYENRWHDYLIALRHHL